MQVIASVLPAMRAYLHRGAVDAQGDALVQPALPDSTLFADLAEAFQHLDSLQLACAPNEDGGVIPGVEADEQAFGASNDLVSEWTPEEFEVSGLPRYQIHVMLTHDDVIP